MGSYNRSDAGNEDVVFYTGFLKLTFESLGTLRCIGMTDHYGVSRIRLHIGKFVYQPCITGLSSLYFVHWFYTIWQKAQYRMDLHLVSDRIRTFRDTAAPLEIIHVVYDEISSCSWQKGRDLLSNLTGRSALIPHSNSGMDQKSLSHSTVFTVDQMQGRRFDVVSGNLGRLESSTHVFGKNNGYDLVSGIQVFLESLLKFVRIYSGGGRAPRPTVYFRD